MVCGREGGREPVAQPPDDLGGVEEVAFQCDGGWRSGGSLPRGSSVNEFCFRDRERDTYVPGPRGYGGEQTLEAAYVPPIGRGGHRDREVVDV